MQGDSDPISFLMFGTIGIAIIVAIFLLVRFMGKPSNRHPMDGEPERNIDQIRREGPEPPL